MAPSAGETPPDVKEPSAFTLPTVGSCFLLLSAYVVYKSLNSLITRHSRTTITGVVRSFNYGPGGLDGLILDSGTVVHFPPEYGNRVKGAPF